MTVEFILMLIVIITLFDVWTLLKHGYDSTISAVLLAAARKWPIIPFLLGMLAGHLFFPNVGQ